MDAQGLKRRGYVALGWGFFTLGLVGAFVPVLPTTPFMILALGAFAKGSNRLHAWLYGHPRFGPALHSWERHRVIPLRAKLLALGTMGTSLAVLVITDGTPPLAVFLASALIASGALYILSKPSRAPRG